MVATIEEIKEEFLLFDINLTDEEILEKLAYLATLFRFEPDDLVNEWLAYQSRNSQCDITIDRLLLLEREITNNRAKKPRIVETKPEINKINVEINDGGLNESLTTLVDVKPSQSYANRSNSGDVINHLYTGDSPGVDFWVNGAPIKGESRVRVGWNGRRKYMFQRAQEASDIVNDFIEIHGDLILKGNPHIEYFTPCANTSQTPVVIMGRIKCDDSAKLTPFSAAIEGDRGVSSGRVVKLGLENAGEYSFFPGQVVALQGVNPDGRMFHVSKVFTLPAKPGRMSVGNCVKDENSVSMLIAAGPFTTSDSLDYKPLLDFLRIVTQQRPDVTIIIGPIVDEMTSETENCQLSKSYADLGKKWLTTIVNSISDVTEVVFVPSQRDLFHHPVYPQPPYNPGHTPSNAHYASNPTTISVGEIKIGVNSADILFHMGAMEIARGGSSDKISRLISHIITQQNFYPLYPADDSVNLDLLSAESSCMMTENVDLLILPGNLRGFVRMVDGHVCINPGRLVKGKGGGSYARVVVSGRTFVGEVVKI